MQVDKIAIVRTELRKPRSQFSSAVADIFFRWFSVRKIVYPKLGLLPYVESIFMLVRR